MRVAFASEIKQLLGLPGLSGRMNIARVHDFLAYGNADHTAQTLFDGVMQLRAGECGLLRATAPGGPRWSTERWYPATAGDLAIGEAEARVQEIGGSLKNGFAVSKMAVNPANLPYHPGALRYYKEKGLVK